MMTSFNEVVKVDTPRLLVAWERGEGSKEGFQWGVIGNISILHLVGAITRLQGNYELAELSPEPTLCIAWDVAQRSFWWFSHPDIPLDPLMGMLEVIKMDLIISLKGGGRTKSTGVQTLPPILGPDGQPIRRQ